jgi:hypothetical protein
MDASVLRDLTPATDDYVDARRRDALVYAT